MVTYITGSSSLQKDHIFSNKILKMVIKPCVVSRKKLQTQHFIILKSHQPAYLHIQQH